jgi:hypothetical protein
MRNAAAASGEGACEARTGPRQTQTCRDNPATARLHRGRPLTTLQPTKQQPATVGVVERGGRVTTARQTTTRASRGCSPRPHTHAGAAPRQLTMHISTNDLHSEVVVVGVFVLGLLADAPRFFFLILTSNFLSKVSCGPIPTLTIALLISAPGSPGFDDGSSRPTVSIDG